MYRFNHLIVIGLVLAVLLHENSAKPQSLVSKVTSKVSSLLGGNKCKEAAETLKTNPNICAILYDEDDCKEDSIAVSTGYTKLSSGFLSSKLKKDDAESIVLRQGCTLVAYDEEEGDNDDVVTFKAPLSSPLIIEELDDDQLNEDIEAVNCFCGQGQVNPITTDGNVGKVKGVWKKLFGGDISKCNKYIDLFNRPGVETCAILFDEEDCDDEYFVVKEGYTSDLDDLEDDAESVMVKPGCVFVGHDRGTKTNLLNAFKQNRNVTISNNDKNSRSVRLNQPLVKNLEGSADLEEDIGAVDCTCK